LSDPNKWSSGKYTSISHNNAKAEIVRVIESRFPELAARMSLVQMGHYVTNWKNAPQMKPQKQSDGSFVIERAGSPEEKIPFVVPHRDTGTFVKALIDVPPGKHLLGQSEEMTWWEWVALWGRVLGVNAVYKQILSEDDFFLGSPDDFRREMWLTFQYVSEFGYTGGDPAVVTVDQASF
jgi:hypothetical protein